MESKIVTVTGIAQNGKAGALVITRNNETYYVQGVEAWEENILGKNLEVTGRLQIEANPEALKNEKGEWIAAAGGEQFILHEAKWKIE